MSSVKCDQKLLFAVTFTLSFAQFYSVLVATLKQC